MLYSGYLAVGSIAKYTYCHVSLADYSITYGSFSQVDVYCIELGALSRHTTFLTLGQDGAKR